jgi:hypothetical protein
MTFTVMMPNACPKCRHRLAVFGPDTSLTCPRCRLHRGHLPKAAFSFLLETARLFGVTNGSVILRGTMHPEMKGL